MDLYYHSTTGYSSIYGGYKKANSRSKGNVSVWYPDPIVDSSGDNDAPISKQQFGLLSINTSRENNCIPSTFKKQSLSKVGQLCEQSQSKRQQFLNKPVLIRSWIFKQL